MNRLAQFLHYTQKVFGLKRLVRGVRDGRPFPRIPTQPVLLSLLLGVVLRISSYLDLSEQTQRRRWRHLCGGKQAVSHDTFEYVTERLNLEDLRLILASVAQTLKRNKALESCKINGLLLVSLDANEHFASRSRCCEHCGQRQVEETDDQGQKHKVTEYYHRYVFAQINGPKINVVLDLEPIGPGEEECTAALRLLGRMRRLYGPRFFDAITVDAWYVRGPFLRSVDKLGWGGDRRAQAGGDGSLSRGAGLDQRPEAAADVGGQRTTAAGAVVGSEKPPVQQGVPAPDPSCAL